jgi:hypothetical protein
VRCVIRSPFPIYILTHLDHNRLINHHFAASNFAHIPKSAQPFIGLDLLLGVTTSITPAADMKAMTRPLLPPSKVWVIGVDFAPSADALHQRWSTKKCSERCRKYCKKCAKVWERAGTRFGSSCGSWSGGSVFYDRWGCEREPHPLTPGPWPA